MIVKLVVFSSLLFFLTYTSISIFKGEEGLNLRLAIKSASYNINKESKTVIIELDEQNNAEYSFKGIQQIKLKGSFPVRILASGSINNSIRPVIKDKINNTEAFAFLDNNGFFFSEYIQINNGTNKFEISYIYKNQVIYSKNVTIINNI